MEQHLVHLLADTQSPVEATRSGAEQSLLALYSNQTFPLGLASISSDPSISLPLRQAALLSLKNFVLAGWSPQLDEFKGQVLLGDQAKATVRDALLDLATSNSAERKIQNIASYVVSKIASADYPNDWSGLVPTLLHLIPQATDNRLHGILKVLFELVEDGFNEEQFFGVAKDLVNALYMVATSEQRPPFSRALAVSTLRACFDTLETIMEVHKAEVKAFAEQALAHWLPFFAAIIQIVLPATSRNTVPQSTHASTENLGGVIALKLQVVKVLMKIRGILPNLLNPHIPILFRSVWKELSSLQTLHEATYILDDQEGRLEDGDGLPYTLDFLVLEDLDFLQACLRAPLVRKELEKQPDQSSSWLSDMLQLAISYAQITAEEENIWAFDVNIYLAEETSVTANYTARTACGDLIIKLSEWLKLASTDALLTQTRDLVSDPHTTWRLKEAALYLLNQILGDWQDVDGYLSPQQTHEFLTYIQMSMQDENGFLRARGHLVLAMLVSTSNNVLTDRAPDLLEATLRAMTHDGSDVVQVSCIKALQQYLHTLPPTITSSFQDPIISTLMQWSASKDMGNMTDSEDLMITIIETLRDVILLDTRVALKGQGLDLLFNVASLEASNFQAAAIVTETFEEICSTIAALGGDAYSQLCQRVLPSLTGAFDVGNITEENALTTLAAELLSQLAKHGTAPLPAGFTQTALPRLNRLLLGANVEELLKSCTSAVKYLLMHDSQRVLAWHDGAGKGGLEVILIIIDRLLGPSVEDNAAAEVGGLAAELVEQAGPGQLGRYLMQLLQAVAVRLANATQAHLIQSLISVFARLSATNPAEVVDFLSQVSIDGTSGLQIVMTKWLENSVNFSGYEDIRQNVTALTKLYQLHEPRLEQVLVKGDLIMPTSNRIMTRSKARQNPDQFTMVSAPVKIIKVLVEELLAADDAGQFLGMGASDAAADGADDEEDVSDDGEWEDEGNVFDAFGATKEQLMAFAAETPGPQRGRDDETQAYLVHFFHGVAAEPSFGSVFNSLSADEQAKLRRLG